MASVQRFDARDAERGKMRGPIQLIRDHCGNKGPGDDNDLPYLMIIPIVGTMIAVIIAWIFG